MAKHSAKCPKCGHRLEYDSAVDEAIVCAHCGARLAAPGTSRAKGASRAEAPTGAKASGADPLIGQCLGDFKILAVLGRGGMGTVYKAVEQSLDRFVAVKVLPQDLATDESFVERFGREARAAAAIDHPNIIEIYRVGEDRGYQFIAMGFVDGESLADLLKREGRLPPARAVEVLRQVASALDVAHGCGILHRDIKPSNILIDRRGRVKVADFGLAKHEGVDVSVTVTGQALGTPLYMPPEGARGRALDARSDLYSLGATFYQAIAGKPPFDGETPAQLIAKHLESRAAPLHQVAPDCPPPLGRLIHRLLRKNPADRYASAGKLLEALARVEGRLAAGQAEATATMATAPAPGTGRRKTTGRKPRTGRKRTRGGRPAGAGLLSRVPRWLWIAAPAALVLVVALAFILSPGGDDGQRPSAVSPPSAPEPKTQHPEPGRPAAAAAERNAEIVFRNVKVCIKKKDYAKAKGYLDRLESQYGETDFAQSHQADLAALQRQIDTYVKGKPKPKTTTPVTPKPGTQHPEPPPAPPPAPSSDDEPRWTQWRTIFDGTSLEGWSTQKAEAARVSVGDGCVTLDGSRALEHGLQARDLVVRAIVRKLSGQNLWLAVRESEGRSYCFYYNGGREFGVQVSVDGQQRNRGRWKSRKTPQGWVEMMVRATDDNLSLWVEGEKLGEVHDPDPQSGHIRFGVYRGRAQFARIEVKTPAPPPDDQRRTEWQSLFDGKTLEGWRVEERGKFADSGRVHVTGGRLALGAGQPRTGVAWTGRFPREGYEVAFEARREGGDGAFVDAVFPVGESACGLSVGGFGGTVGLTLVDGKGSGHNPTTQKLDFEQNRWYRFRLRVASSRIAVWIDGKKRIDLPTAGHTLKTNEPGRLLRPFGLGTCLASSSIRDVRLRRLPPQPPAGDDERWTEWQSLFDGKTLDGWRPATGGAFSDPKQVAPEDGVLVLEAAPGGRWPGAVATRPVPRSDYEVAYEARRVRGEGDFASLTFPVGGEFCTLIVGGFDDGDVFALDQVDGERGEDNPTTHRVPFANGRWYAVRVRVTDERVRAWLDGRQLIDQPRAGHRFDLSPAGEVMRPFGVYARPGRAQVRDIRLRRLRPDGAAQPGKPEAKATPTQAGPRDRQARELLKPAEAKAAAWDFAAAAAELAKLKIEDRALAERVARRREDIERMAALKKKMIQRIDTAKPKLRKSSLGIRGMNADLARADEDGITTAKLPTGKTETFAWGELDADAVRRLVDYTVETPADHLAAGILLLRCGRHAPRDGHPHAEREDYGAVIAAAEEHFAQAKAGDLAIARYLDPLAAAAFAHVQALLEAGDFRKAAAALDAMEKDYAETDWLAAHQDEIAAARARARGGIADAQAERLYTRAAKLYAREDLWALKPVIAKLKADCPDAALLTDATRKPTFAEMAEAVADLGQRLSVRKDGHGDFKSIQAAINAAPPNSVIEIQDEGVYRETVVISKPGTTLRGKEGLWPAITSIGHPDPPDTLVVAAAPDVTLAHVFVSHTTPEATRMQ
ncbi:MAG: protein kinase domain-containing protein, partial [Planctomycetota bacterium]